MPLFTITTKSPKENFPVGNYTCTFGGLEKRSNEGGNYWIWKFTTEDGKSPPAFSDADLTPKPTNKMGRWLTALCGQPFHEELQVDTDQYIGQKYLVIVADYVDPKGKAGTRVETFSRLAS
jgi:hypothetical protein